MNISIGMSGIASRDKFSLGTPFSISFKFVIGMSENGALNKKIKIPQTQF